MPRKVVHYQTLMSPLLSMALGPLILKVDTDWTTLNNIYFIIVSCLMTYLALCTSLAAMQANRQSRGKRVPPEHRDPGHSSSWPYANAEGAGLRYYSIAMQRKEVVDKELLNLEVKPKGMLALQEQS